MITKDPDPQISEPIDMQSQECTNTAENDLVIHEVKLAPSPTAMSPLTWVPKPRPPTPYDTSVQRAEFTTNMQPYLASR